MDVKTNPHQQRDNYNPASRATDPVFILPPDSRGRHDVSGKGLGSDETVAPFASGVDCLNSGGIHTSHVYSLP